MERSSGLEKLNADSLSCSNKLTVQGGQPQAFLNSEVQVSGIVNGQAVLLSEREHLVVRCGVPEAYVQFIQRGEKLFAIWFANSGRGEGPRRTKIRPEELLLCNPSARQGNTTRTLSRHR